MHTDRLRLRLIGGFALETVSGKDCTPPGINARCLLVLLALSPQQRRSRRWIESKLWSERDAVQASGSLRQTLAELRRHLGDRRDAVRADRVDLWLDPTHMAVDLFEDASSAAAAAARGAVLVDGLDPRDEEFDEWLREERATFAARASRPPIAAPRIDVILAAFDDTVAGGLARHCADHVAQLVGDYSTARILRPRIAVARIGPQARGIAVWVEVRPAGRRATVGVRVVSSATGTWLWSGEATASTDALVGRTPALDALIFDAAEAVFQAIPAVVGEDHGIISADAMLSRATRELFTFDPDRLLTARDLVAKANALSPDPRLDAWQALINSCLAIEGGGNERDAFIDEAHRLADRSLCDGRDNPLVLAMAGHIRVVLRRDLDAGLALARKSLLLRPSNPFAAVTLQAALIRSGDVKAAHAISRRATVLTRRSPMGHWWTLSTALSAIAVGRYDEAIAAAEATRAIAPKCRAALRCLYALYTHRRDAARAHEIGSVMRRMEPDFSLALIRGDRGYPADTLRSTGLANLRDIA